MGWLASLFRRGDPEAAAQLAAEAVGSRLAPDAEAIASETGVKLDRVLQMIRETISNDIALRVHQGVAAAEVPTQAIHDDAVAMGLDGATAVQDIQSALSVHFTALVQDVLADGVVDPEEDRRISSFMAMIGQSVLAPETASLIEEGRQAYRACSAPLTAVDAPVLLNKGEFCVYAVNAEALEDRSRTVRVGYHGASARIRIAKGIYYNAGSMAVSRQTESYQHSFGMGVLCMTNQRLLWISPDRSISTLLRNIVRFDPYSDGIRIFKGTGKPLLFIWAGGARVATIMASRTIEELR